MTITAARILGVLVALGWSPVALHFVRSFLRRRNPISLAIAGVVFLLAFSGLLPLWLNGKTARGPELLLGLYVLQVIACVSFHLTLWWSARYFASERKE